MRFSGKTALVTGAAGGIGQAIVAGLRAEGARVATADRDSSAIAADAHLDGDLLNPEYCDGLITATVAALGSIDIIVNNAGAAVINPSQYSGFNRSPSKCASAGMALLSRSAVATRAPSARKPATIACPIPPAAPVTSAVFPENLMTRSLSIWSEPIANGLRKTA